MEAKIHELRLRLHRGDSLRLLCHCHPRMCHAHGIARRLARSAPAEQYSTPDRLHGCAAMNDDAEHCDDRPDESSSEGEGLYELYERSYGEP